MKEKRMCPNCDEPLIKKKIHIAAGPSKNSKLPDIETRDAYMCPKCKELFFEEDLNFQKP